MTIPDPLARAIRTAVQTALGVFLTLTVLPGAAPGTVPDWDTLKRAGLAALFAGVVALLTWGYNALKQAGVVPTALKPPPPVPPDPPATSPK
jgi:hypothetical protein